MAAALLTRRLFTQYALKPTSALYGVLRGQHNVLASSPSTYNSVPNPDRKIIPVFRYAAEFPDKIAIQDRHGDFTYKGLFNSSKIFSEEITKHFGGKTQERVAFLCPNDASYLIIQWACWMSGQIAVPLSSAHPPAMHEYFITDSDAQLIITTSEYSEQISEALMKTDKKLIILDDCLKQSAMKIPNQKTDPNTLPPPSNIQTLEAGLNPNFYQDSNALIIYTSGSTGKPKGVVLSYSNLHHQIWSMVDMWNWTSKDNVVHCLPLHHVHGIVNVLMVPLHLGARCTMLPKFDAVAVWNKLLSINIPNTDRVNIMMGVPTMYTKLIEEYEKLFSENQRMVEYVKATCSQRIRLMVSGSAPLPENVFTKWHDITGHLLLERYGMSEAGMILSNTLESVDKSKTVSDRKAGSVGIPMPGVEIQLARFPGTTHPEAEYDSLVKSTHTCSAVNISEKNVTGEILVKGPNLFKGYWKKPKATEKEFTKDGWFKTGDTASYVDGVYKLLGRTSVDIIKTGGYKVSAIEVETMLREHPDISECVVLGVDDLTWGQKVVAVIVPGEKKENSETLSLQSLRDWSKRMLPAYAIPTDLRVVENIQKNAMGKVNKKALIEQLFPSKETFN